MQAHDSFMYAHDIIESVISRPILSVCWLVSQLLNVLFEWTVYC